MTLKSMPDSGKVTSRQETLQTEISKLKLRALMRSNFVLIGSESLVGHLNFYSLEKSLKILKSKNGGNTPDPK